MMHILIQVIEMTFKTQVCKADYHFESLESKHVLESLNI